MQAILEAASKKVDINDAEVFCESWNEDSVDFEMDKLKSVKTRQVAGYGLRIIKDGRIGFTGGTSYDPDDMINMALSSARFGPPAAFRFPGKTGMKSMNIFDEKIDSLQVADMTEKGYSLLEYLKSRRGDVQWDVFFKRYVTFKRILSGKIDSMYRKTIYDFSLVAHSIKEGDFLHIYDGFSTSRLQGGEEEIRDSILNILQLAEKEVKIKTGIMPVIFTPAGFKDIIRNLIVNTNGKMVEKGASPLADKIGEKILPDSVNIFDDGTIDGTAGAEPFDDEGMPVERFPIVEKGILKNFVLDLQTAAILKMKPTGSGARSYSSQPRPSVHGVIVEPGNDSVDDMIKNIKEGILIDQLIGSHTGNPFTGDFQLNIDLGFKIENGEKTGRVKNVMIAGNFYELFASLAGFSKETKWDGNYCLPYAGFERLSVAGE